jgi:hypothetical protein
MPFGREDVIARGTALTSIGSDVIGHGTTKASKRSDVIECGTAGARGGKVKSKLRPEKR